MEARVTYLKIMPEISLENQFLLTIGKDRKTTIPTPPLNWITTMHTRKTSKTSMRHSLSKSVTSPTMDLWKRERLNNCTRNKVSPCTTQSLMLSQCTNIYSFFPGLMPSQSNLQSIHKSLWFRILSCCWVLYWIWLKKISLACLHMFSCSMVVSPHVTKFSKSIILLLIIK